MCHYSANSNNMQTDRRSAKCQGDALTFLTGGQTRARERREDIVRIIPKNDMPLVESRISNGIYDGLTTRVLGFRYLSHTQLLPLCCSVLLLCNETIFRLWKSQESREEPTDTMRWFTCECSHSYRFILHLQCIAASETVKPKIFSIELLHELA